MGRVYLNEELMKTENLKYENFLISCIRNINGVNTLCSTDIRRFFPKVKRYTKLKYHSKQMANICVDELVNFCRIISNSFMKFLIVNRVLNNINYEAASSTFIEKNKKILSIIDIQEIKSLLKPVYTRYMKLNKFGSIGAFTNILKSMENKIIPKKIVLYDIPVVIKDSKLKIIKDFYLPLEEQICITHYGYQRYKCITLRIKKIDRLELNIVKDPANTGRYVISELNFYGYTYIKE